MGRRKERAKQKKELVKAKKPEKVNCSEEKVGMRADGDGRRRRRRKVRRRVRSEHGSDVSRRRGHSGIRSADRRGRKRKRRRASRSRSRGRDSVAADWGRGSTGQESRSRSRRRSPSLRGRSSERHRGFTPELRVFRERYPCDDRAFNILASAPSETKRTVLQQFKPRREGDSDYSALVASFTRKIALRREQDGRGQGRDRARQRKSPARLPSLEDDGRDCSRGDGSRTGSRVASRGGSRDRRREDSAISTFRARYPMDERAFAALERAPSGVRDVVLSDFRPRREGDDDYSALVMTFVRAVQQRVGDTSRR